MLEELVPEPLDLTALQSLDLERQAWIAGRVLDHIYEIAYASNSFNPGKGRGRFHPIHTAAGSPIPTLYAGTTFVGALCETLFRLEPTTYTLRPHPVPKKRALQSAYAKLAPTRSLELLHLGGNSLRQLRLLRGQLLEPGPSHYLRTSAWAMAFHRAFPAIDGLIWRSRQHDESHSIVLFGDRVFEAELEIVEEVSFEPPLGWQMLLEAAKRAGFTISES